MMRAVDLARHNVGQRRKGDDMPFCANCGTGYEAGQAFCSKCGNQLGVDAPPTRAVTQHAGAPRTNGFAIAALVLGIIPLFGIGPILAIIFGYKGRREIDASGGTQKGRGMATAGVVLGWIWIALLIVAIIAIAVGDSASAPRY